MERFPNESNLIEYTKEVLRVKMDIQRAVISHFCGGDVHNTDKVNTWIQQFSSKFREIFEYSLKQDPDFLNRAEREQEVVVLEIVTLLEKKKKEAA